MRFPLRLVVFRAYVNVIEVNLKKHGHLGCIDETEITPDPGMTRLDHDIRSWRCLCAAPATRWICRRRRTKCRLRRHRWGRRSRTDAGRYSGCAWIHMGSTNIRILSYVGVSILLWQFTSFYIHELFFESTYIILVYRIIWWNLWMDSVHFDAPSMVNQELSYRASLPLSPWPPWGLGSWEMYSELHKDRTVKS